MDKNRRVVVTGIGAITPLGKTTSETWEGLKNGKNGIAPITAFDTENFKAKLGAEVKDFDPKEYMDVNDTLRTDRYAQFAVAAADQAVEESKIEGTVDPDRFAVIFGTGIGGIGTFEREHTKLMERGPRRVSSLFVPMMIGNMASGMIAIRHDCRGRLKLTTNIHFNLPPRTGQRTLWNDCSLKMPIFRRKRLLLNRTLSLLVDSLIATSYSLTAL